MDVYRTPDERFAALPGYAFAPRYLMQEGLRMHYVDEGAGEPVLLLHGEPTWSFLYRKMIPALAASSRVVAADYFGFGRSDKPAPRDFYTYERHYESIERLADALDLRDLTLVLHDWGGPIGFRLAVERPERVARLVILNTGIFVDEPLPEAWFRFRDFVRRVGAELRPGALVKRSCVTPLPDDIVAGYDALFPVAEAKAGVLAFPELVPAEAGHPSTEAMRAVGEALARWEKPALVLFGDADPIFPPQAGSRLAARIPGALPPEIVSGAAHFLQEDRGEELAARIAAFLAGTRQAVH